MKNLKQYSALILLLLVVATWSYFVNPSRSSIKELEDQLSELKTQVTQSDNQKQLEDEVQLTELDKVNLEAAIPQGFDQELLVKLFNQTANDNTVRLNSINFNKSLTAENGVQTVQINLNGITAKADLEKFLFDLESNSRGFFIKNISVSFNEIEGFTRASFTINLESYFT